jgi:prepilin-type N-terminal cleavage/methylation domain-containing protein
MKSLLPYLRNSMALLAFRKHDAGPRAAFLSRNQHGFSLIELIIVTAVITILVTVGAISFRRSADHNDALTAANTLKNAYVEAQANATNGVNRQGNRLCTTVSPYSSPSSANTERMEGWIVSFTNATTLGLYLKCNNGSAIGAADITAFNNTFRMPAGIQILGTPSNIAFSALNRGVYSCPAVNLITRFTTSCAVITATQSVTVRTSANTSAYRVDLSPTGLVTTVKLY